MRIDSHHHLWDLAIRDQPWTADLPPLRRSFSIDDLRPALGTYAIERTIVVQTVCDESETHELLADAARSPTIAGVVGWADLTTPGVADDLSALRARPGGAVLAGIRHQVQEEPDPDWLLRSDVRHGLDAVGAADLTYDLVVKTPQWPATVAAVRASPNTRFVLDHAGKPQIVRNDLVQWRRMITELSRESNVAVKLSGLVTEADPDSWTVDDLRPYADVLVDSFGPDRVMFGSDWPVCLLAGSYDDVFDAAVSLTADLSNAERRQVFGGSAAHWYRLAL